jgi:hypothetical protein
MAKLTSLLQFNGTLDGLTAYNLPGVDKPVVRTTRGPSKKDLYSQPRYANTRRNLSETGGRGRAVSWLMKAFQPLKPLVDADTAGQLNKLLRAVQKGEEASAYGKRTVLLSRFPQLLEGFRLTKSLPFDTVVRGEVYAQMDRSTLTASVALPALLHRLTFFPPPGYPYCRIAAVLGVAPDLVHDEPMYRTGGDYTNCYAQPGYTDWLAAGAGAPPTTLQLQLPYAPPTEAFALVLTIAVQFGEPGLTGGVEPVGLRVGSAKILAAV